MSQENVETIARLYDEFFSQPDRVFDPEVLQFFDPAVELRQDASMLGTAGTFHGYDGLVRGARELFEAFRDLHWIPIRLIGGGDHVVATIEARGYGKHSDVEFRHEIAHAWTLREGRIVAWDVYYDAAEALESLNL
jgi:ketosteroid isomerase-like protein